MRFAIVESGGKQYRAVEGRTIEVDRLSMQVGTQYNLERVLLMTDGDEVMIGTPAVDGIEVKATVVDHIKGPKLISFKYRPKKRIRVKGGHRQQYTRLMIDFIGKPGETRKKEEKPVVEKKEAKTEVVVEAKPKTEKKAKAEKPAKASKEAAKPSAKKAPAKKTTTAKTSSKKTDTKKK
ncbi:MAG TPA: 50S ribosomal protein L21 [Anaerolineae bacterium]|nr:50S ribosomal protein L21 [Anaerolineae bacterium]